MLITKAQSIDIENSKIKDYRDREETQGLLHLKAKSINIEVMIIPKSQNINIENDNSKIKE